MAPAKPTAVFLIPAGGEHGVIARYFSANGDNVTVTMADNEIHGVLRIHTTTLNHITGLFLLLTLPGGVPLKSYQQVDDDTYLISATAPANQLLVPFRRTTLANSSKTALIHNIFVGSDDPICDASTQIAARSGPDSSLLFPSGCL
jgi:hypothetical protein